MQPDPTQQSLTFQKTAGVYGPKPIGSRSFSDYGVLWSASRPTGALASNWNTSPAVSPTPNYGGTATTYPEPSPYAQTSGVFWNGPSNPGKSGRRMMRLLFLDCPSAGGNCRPAPVLGVGKFFLQKKSNVSSDKEIYLEYSGQETNLLRNATLKLYRVTP